jgi:putative acetyltransferase
MRPQELAEVRDLAAAAFGDDHQISRLFDLLAASWAWDGDLSFVAEHAGEIVGQVLYTHAFLDADPQLVDVLVLSPLAVRADVRNRGVGRRLVSESLKRLEGRDEPLVFLEGHPGYYPRFGFERGRDLGFTAPSTRIPDDAFMVYRLPGYRPWMRGRLVYPDPFWRADAVGLRDQPSGQ